ncbi:helix-turn-helix domain-containing protein [Taibaiella koreensis]|uniref:helix-turn-helix domain-containing protein n=1 Tax=Taibaiella koreensis TaxID=1268548 RepID=UPI000E59BBEE|nr:pentapeptide repeat-containing protein [Taibaiella koreensis]
MEAKIIGNKIGQARKEKNMSQAQLAELLFISPQAVGKWERGESVPDIITFSRLAEILGVDLNYFSNTLHPAAIGVAHDKGAAEGLPAIQEKKLSWDMSRGNWIGADFSGLKNLHEKFSSSNMLRCRFVGSDMSGLLLKRNNVDSCDFSGSDFNGSRILGSYLSKNIFKDCSLREAAFSESYASGCDFSGADLTGMTVKSGGIEKSNMLDAILHHTSFDAVQFADIIFEGTVADCSFEQCTFTRVTFRNTTLINTFFKCRSLKRIRLIDCRADRMTYEFLKNGKADLSGVTLLSS